MNDFNSGQVPPDQRQAGCQEETAFEALHNLESYYRAVADFTYDWEYWESPDGTLRYVSPSCERITGYEAARFLDDPQLLSELVVPDDRVLWAAHRHSRKDAEPEAFQFRIRHQDGGIRWIEHVCQPVRDEQGVFWGHRVSNRDITERKRAEEEVGRYRDHLEELVDERTAALARANKLLRQEVAERKRAEVVRSHLAAIVESTDDAVIGKALDGIITSWNAGAERIYGYSAQEAIGQPVSILVPPEDLGELDEILERLKQGERVEPFETERIHKDGRRIPVSLNISPIKDESGRAVGASTIARDITRSKEVEQALREAIAAAEAAQREEQARRQEAERRRRIAESLGDVLAVLNSDRSLAEVLDYIAVQAGQLLDARGAGIYRLDGETGELTLQATQGMLLAYVAGADLPVGKDALQQAMAIRRPVPVSNLTTAFPSAPEQPLMPEGRLTAAAWLSIYRAALAVPIIVQGEIYGGMLVYYGQPRDFSEEEVELAATFAAQVALAIENAWLRDRVRQAAAIAERDRLARELHDAVTQTLFSASLIAEAMPRVWEQDPERGRRGLEELRQLTRGAAAEMRTMLLELRLAALTEKPLGELLRHLTEAMAGRMRVPISLAVDGKHLLGPDV